MQKLKKKKINNLLNYQHFLKNNDLKKNKFKLKKILFENQILYKNIDSNIIELNNYENIYLPSTVLNLNNIYTIQTQYENQLLFNYNLNYDILYHFNSIIFKNIIQKNNNIIKGRIIGGTNKKVLVSILGVVFSMKPINLNNLINNKKTFYINKKNKFKKKKFFYIPKKIQPKQLINSYKLRYLNFKIDIINDLNLKKKKILSRVSYLQELIKNHKINKIKKKKIIFKKSVLSRKLYVREINQKKK
jgi:hypothetical protein